MSIMMERYLRKAGISTPMGRVLDEAVLREDVYHDLSQWIQDNGTTKPGRWDEIPNAPDVVDMAFKAAIKRLPLITDVKTPMDKFGTGHLKATHGIGVVKLKTRAIIVDTSGYDYVRIAVGVPSSWVK